MEQRATTKEHIISEAKKLFTSQGFAEVSMSMIAKEVGITKAALYHFFENKASIYITVIEDVFLAIGEVLDAAVATPAAAIPLVDVIEHVIAVGMQEGNVILRMDKCPLLTEKEHMHTLFQTFFQKVEHLLAHYDVPETGLAAHVFLNAVHGYIKWAHIDPDVPDIRRYSDYLATLFHTKT
ncbi:MAG: transcriptional regulator, TetR family protein [Candidatus Magasanikbacteria bacterium GW2011_GWD2_43_18]|nr:MAG: transcriptional regulator, TetR family protein [Candidatus Magasanikbacteria bacterium GW2011_GWC2_42_27]KKT04716.1 MAG: transcriptional regulator, TetR family protein [Candidatus Magasanikbacteria bacterium GW2011_GWD2_43_18]KKT24976.1 MAG: transcriptional regulator, TetR family protein [Candidatus Magasanikbacteria bacterium GW2011_GWA2_43_9]HBB38023.1 hypothetical protein [Candidatus Magasanikbacteria bacterium]HCC13226.1 hypothetical protein [Candidatus Magasanikbacteria bacterium]